MRSVYDAVKVVTAIAPSTLNATGTPVAARVSEIDTFGFSTAVIDVATGSPTGTPTTFTVAVSVQESATSGGTFTDVSGATGTITGTTTTITARCQIRVEGLGVSRSRYLKVTANLSALGQASAVVPLCGQALLGRGFKEPVSNSATGGP